MTPTEYNQVKPWFILSEVKEKGEVVYSDLTM